MLWIPNFDDLLLGETWGTWISLKRRETIFKSRLLCDIFFVQKDELSIHHRMNGKKIIQYPYTEEFTLKI